MQKTKQNKTWHCHWHVAKVHELWLEFSPWDGNIRLPQFDCIFTDIPVGLLDWKNALTLMM